ncbi:MAG: 4-(cytidine 5'-diphospho)-2-C-methyl-D-erythritol kinase [Bacteroidales bacterium]|nr:4-(cytidine 5'-diphospho)-2-C-methyl-D-erythritol kinase [Bacteroidales bacterium]
MLSFPNAKINIGLRVVGKRPDGYHNIETVFCPVNLCDILEFVPQAPYQKQDIHFTVTGDKLSVSPEDNLCVKAYRLLKNDYTLPPLSVHLHKIIPVGAGLGGGSSDAAFMLKSLNNFFQLGISENGLCNYASTLGSDCAFFIKNRPVLGTGRGDRFIATNLKCRNYEVIIVHPGIHINTADAYAGVKPKKPETLLEELIKLPPGSWKQAVQNDFEPSVFQKYPDIAAIKQQLYEIGAVYASMSGSGSSVYGLFEHAPDAEGMFKGMFCWKGYLITGL